MKTTRITVKRAEQLNDLAEDVEAMLSNVLTALADLMDPDTKGDDRTDASESLESAMSDLSDTMTTLMEGWRRG